MNITYLARRSLLIFLFMAEKWVNIIDVLQSFITPLGSSLKQKNLLSKQLSFTKMRIQLLAIIIRYF